MTERPDPAPNPEILPDAIASRLLARASELDVVRDDGLAVTDLRAAAAEAGIAGRAFDAALAELRGAGRVGTSDASARRRPGLWIGTIAGAAALIAAGLFAVVQPRAATGVAEAPPGAPPAEAAAVSAPAHVVVRSAGGAPSVTMEVGRDGQLFAALGVAPGADGRRVGRVLLTGAGGTATTPAALEVSGEPGAVTFSAPAGGRELELTVPGTSLRARGHAVRLVREHTGGPLRAEIVPPSAR